MSQGADSKDNIKQLDIEPKDIDKLDFEQALAMLNKLVGKLEAGELPLEQSVAAFETGVKLSRRCESLLDAAEQRLQVLSDDQDA